MRLLLFILAFVGGLTLRAQVDCIPLPAHVSPMAVTYVDRNIFLHGDSVCYLIEPYSAHFVYRWWKSTYHEVNDRFTTPDGVSQGSIDPSRDYHRAYLPLLVDLLASGQLPERVFWNADDELEAERWQNAYVNADLALPNELAMRTISISSLVVMDTPDPALKHLFFRVEKLSGNNPRGIVYDMRICLPEPAPYPPTSAKIECLRVAWLEL